jgi:hypothetical protein
MVNEQSMHPKSFENLHSTKFFSFKKSFGWISSNNIKQKWMGYHQIVAMKKMMAQLHFNGQM